MDPQKRDSNLKEKVQTREQWRHWTLNLAKGRELGRREEINSTGTLSTVTLHLKLFNASLVLCNDTVIWFASCEIGISVRLYSARLSVNQLR